MRRERTISRLAQRSTRAVLAIVALATGFTTGAAQSIALPVPPSAATGIIRGVLIDSLRGNEPIAGGIVELEGAGVQMVTDIAGRFVFTGVAAGRHVLSHTSRMLDSLGLSSIATEVTVNPRKTINAVIATPGAATYQRAFCGTTYSPQFGVLRGQVMREGSRVGANARLALLWQESSVKFGMYLPLDKQIVATANSAGVFVLCGAPLWTDVTLSVTEPGAADTARVLVRVNHAVGRRDVAFDPRAPTVRVVGRVVDEALRVLRDAEVVDLFSGVTLARADATGAFSFTMRRLSRQLAVRTRDSNAEIRNIDPGDGNDIDVGTIELMAGAVQVALMPVEQARVDFERFAYARRRNAGIGVFIEDGELRRAETVDAAFVYRRADITHLIRDDNKRLQLVMYNGPDSCAPRFFLNGTDVGTPDAAEQDRLFKLAKRMELYRDANLQRPFFDPNRCGGVIIWTR